VSERCFVKCLPHRSPVREVMIQKRHEPLAVIRRNEVSHLVKHHIIEALRRFFRHLQIQPDMAQARIYLRFKVGDAAGKFGHPHFVAFGQRARAL
jgi:hypothetical protein